MSIEVKVGVNFEDETLMLSECEAGYYRIIDDSHGYSGDLVIVLGNVRLIIDKADGQILPFDDDINISKCMVVPVKKFTIEDEYYYE